MSWSHILAAAMNTPIWQRGKSVCILAGGIIDAEKLSNILLHKK
jgi:hypothetical protein